jgi:hypothetical protein
VSPTTQRWMHTLMIRQKSSNGTQELSLIDIFPRIIPAIIDDDDKIKDYLPGALYLWKSLYDKHGGDLNLLQMAGGLFEHADPGELAAQLQLHERRAIVTCLWDCLQADDRRKRIAVG